MLIGIVGNGVVGSATAKIFSPYYEVLIYDQRDDRCLNPFYDVVRCDLVFVCLPSPQREGSLECDLSAIDDFFNFKFGSANREAEVREKTHFVLRSTVPIGTTRLMRQRHMLRHLVHSPEFLTARTSFVDALTPTQLIIGGKDRADFLRPPEGNCHRVLYELYTKRFHGVLVHSMTSDESEAVKLMTNSFFGVKIAFFNEMRLLADKLGLSWPVLLGGVLGDGRIAHSHTQVPGPDGKFGFGGACLPKDLGFLVNQMEKAAGSMFEFPLVTNAALNRNKLDRDRT